MKIIILHQDCDPELAKDRSLPYNSYLVEYENSNKSCYDLVISNKKSDIFDHYWDKYREGLKAFNQSEGRINPKLWGNKPKEEKRRR